MTDVLVATPSWFLIFLVIVLGGYFFYSVKRLFEGLKESFKDLKNMIEKLFEDRNDHADRITALEARCEERHGQRTGHERRKTHESQPAPS